MGGMGGMGGMEAFILEAMASMDPSLGAPKVVRKLPVDFPRVLCFFFEDG